MIFIMNTEGTVTTAVSSPLYQGSDNANEITLLAPFPSNTTVIVTFRLPNGQYVYPYFAEHGDAAPYTATLIETLSEKFFDANGTGYNLWKLSVDYPLTQYAGDLQVQFMLTYGETTRTSSSEPLTVVRGNQYLPPSIDDPALQTLFTAVQAANTAAGEAGQSAMESRDSATAAENSATDAANSANLANDYYINASEEADRSEAAADRAEAAAQLNESLAETLGNLEDTLDAIIQLQDYYTGATFDELQDYAEAIEQGGAT